VIRYAEERAGRQRELYQVGAELLGLAGEAAEAEVLRLFRELAHAAGCRALQVVLGFAGALDGLLLAAEVEDPVRLAAAVARRERGDVRAACSTLLQVVEAGVPGDPEELGEEAAARLRSVIALRDELAARFPDVLLTVDLAEFARHSLDPRLSVAEGDRPYYDGLVFHAYAGPAALPVGGGGRYDRLFALLGAELPAVGFSLNLERTLEAGEGKKP
jgi:ATP phosphoribosyltransferase regulatory subunit